MQSLNQIPAAIKSIFEGEKQRSREDLSPVEVAWAYQILNLVLNPNANIPQVSPVIIGGVAVKIYCEWLVDGVERHGKPITRKTADLDVAAVISQNRIIRAAEEAKKIKLAVEYLEPKGRMKIKNFNEIGIDVSCNGVSSKCIPTAEICESANTFILGSTPVRVISEPYLILSKMKATAERGHREKIPQDAIDVASLIYVRYGSVGDFFSEESEKISKMISRGYTAPLGIYSEQQFVEAIKNVVEQVALLDETPLSVLRGVAKDEAMSPIREKVQSKVRERGIELENAKRMR